MYFNCYNSSITNESNQSENIAVFLKPSCDQRLQNCSFKLQSQNLAFQQDPLIELLYNVQILFGEYKKKLH